MCGLARAKSLSPLCTIHTYPSRWPLDQDNDDLDRFQQPVKIGMHVDAPPGASIVAQRNALLPAVLDGIQAELINDPADHAAFEAMLARPLPFWKRAIDIIGAICGLVLCSPLMLFSALAIKLTSKGPVMFTQQCAGLGGKPFKIYKFRTMARDAEAPSTAFVF